MIDLKPFCGDNDIRYYLNEPFSEGEFTYATNGHILIRVPRRDDAKEVEADSMKNRLPKMFADNPFLLPVEIPDIPPMVEGDCDCCNGEGTHDYKCGNAPPYACGECNGTGKQMTELGDTQWPEIEVGNAAFAPKYLRLIKTLPGIQFSPNTRDHSAAFKFDGGDGLLMPMRKRS